MDVSIRELKNHLSQYLRRVQAGEAGTVALRGRRIARLVAEATEETTDPEAAAIARLRAQRWIIPARERGPLKGADRTVRVPPGTSEEITR